jgi:hypothetical protein
MVIRLLTSFTHTKLTHSSHLPLTPIHLSGHPSTSQVTHPPLRSPIHPPCPLEVCRHSQAKRGHMQRASHPSTSQVTHPPLRSPVHLSSPSSMPLRSLIHLSCHPSTSRPRQVCLAGHPSTSQVTHPPPLYVGGSTPPACPAGSQSEQMTRGECSCERGFFVALAIGEGLPATHERVRY